MAERRKALVDQTGAFCFGGALVSRASTTLFVDSLNGKRGNRARRSQAFAHEQKAVRHPAGA